LRSLAAEEAVALSVAGSSMEPGLAAGDRVWIEARRLYWPGDRVVFATEGGSLLLHRVVGYRLHRGRWALLAQGDAAAAPDGPVPRGRVLGKVVRSEPRGRAEVGWRCRWAACRRGLRAALAALARRPFARRRLARRPGAHRGLR
jgi:signal peptidase I